MRRRCWGKSAGTGTGAPAVSALDVAKTALPCETTAVADLDTRSEGTKIAVRRTVRGAAKGSLGHLGLKTN